MKNEWLVIGLGYVGLTYSVHLANNTSILISGTDTSPQKISNLRRGKSYIYEKNFVEEFQKAIHSKNLSFISPNQINKMFDALIVCIETPLPSQSYEKEFAQFVDSLFPYLKHLEKNGFLFLRSTVSIGTTNKVREELLKREREDVNVIFLPERTAAGSAVEELISLPQLFGVAFGCDNKRAREVLSLVNSDLIELSSSDAAEITKLIGNAWRDSTFALANSIAAIAREFKVNVEEIITAANHNYARNNIPRPGFVGGPCLSKDTYILGLNPRTGTSADLFIESRKVNEKTSDRIVKEIFEIISECNYSKIYIVGITFKGFPATNDVRNSLGCLLVDEISVKFPNHEIFVIDPVQHHLDTHLMNVKFVNPDDLQAESLVIITNSYDFVNYVEFNSSIIELGKYICVYDAAGTANTLAHLPNYRKFGDYDAG